MLTVSDNCVDRHAEEHPDRVAIIWERDEPGDTQFITYRYIAEFAPQSVMSLNNHLRVSHITGVCNIILFPSANYWRVHVVLPMCSRGRE